MSAAHQRRGQHPDGAADARLETVALVPATRDVVHDPVRQLASRLCQSSLRRRCPGPTATTSPLSLLLSLRSETGALHDEQHGRWPGYHESFGLLLKAVLRSQGQFTLALLHPLKHWFFTDVPRNYESRIFLFYYYHDSGGIL